MLIVVGLNSKLKINNNYMIKNDLDKSLNCPESCLKIQAGGM